MIKRRRFTVRVPATTANLGSAFDCMAMALDLWSEVVVETGDGAAPRVEVTGEGADSLPEDSSNLVFRSMTRLFRKAGARPPTPSLICRNGIPLKRGLGSSAAAIVGGLTAANHLLGSPFADDDVLLMAVELEGHPDNVAAALYGGARIVTPYKEGLIASPVRIPPGLNAVLYTPDKSVSTDEARSVLPGKVSHEDAVFNMGRAALLVNALASDRVEDLRAATEDRLHQPYRYGLFPPMRLIIAEALKAGALGAFVSGSGSTVLALARGKEMSVAYEMAEMARKANAPGRVLITRPSERGAHVVDGSD